MNRISVRVLSCLAFLVGHRTKWQTVCCVEEWYLMWPCINRVYRVYLWRGRRKILQTLPKWVSHKDSFPRIYVNKWKIMEQIMERKIKSIRSLCVVSLYERGGWKLKRMDASVELMEKNRKEEEEEWEGCGSAEKWVEQSLCVHSKTMARTNATITRERNHSWLSAWWRRFFCC